MSARFKLNRAGLRALQKEVDESGALRPVAEEIRQNAKQLLHRGSNPRYGHMVDHFVVGERDGLVAVGNRNGLYHLAEFGSVNNPAYAPLRRAVRAAGLELKESSI